MPSSTLELHGSPWIFTGCYAPTLFTSGCPSPQSGYFPLFTQGYVELNSTTTIFIEGYRNLQSSGNIPLVLRNTVELSNTGLLYTSGYAPPAHNNISLYITTGPTIPKDKNIPCYTFGTDITRGTAYINSHSISLYMLGRKNELNSNIPLNIYNNQPSLDYYISMPLYMNSEVPVYSVCDAIPLYLYNAGSGSSLKMVVWGKGIWTNYIGKTNDISLFIGTHSEGRSLPLYCHTISGAQNLTRTCYLKNSVDITGSMPLYVHNPSVSTNITRKMFVDGAYIAEGSVQLSIPKVSVGINSWMRLYMDGRNTSSNSIKLHSWGYQSIHGSLKLRCEHHGGIPNSYRYLFTKAANPVNQTTLLVMPKTVDTFPSELSLFITGY